MSVPARIIASADIFRRRATVRTSARTASSGPSVVSSARRRSAFAVILRGSPQMWRVVVFGGSQTQEKNFPKQQKRAKGSVFSRSSETRNDPYRAWVFFFFFFFFRFDLHRADVTPNRLRRRHIEKLRRPGRSHFLSNNCKQAILV